MRTNFFKRSRGHQVEFLIEGEAYYTKFLDLIRQSKKNIHLQTYIFEMDAFGRAVHEELIRAAQRGVKVYALVDSVGSMNMSGLAGDQLVAAGVHFCRFNGFNFKWLGQLGRRLHHKILLTDEDSAFIGGINVVSSSYGNASEPQLDFAVFVKGEVTAQLTQYCRFIFSKACGKKSLFKDEPTLIKEGRVHENIEGTELGVSINDWVYRRWQITKQYSQLTKKAKSDILIVNSYFFPRRKFMKQLAAAAKRGVRVRLVLPKLSDWPSYILGSQYLYSYFFKHGIEIYHWKKSILHGKLATIDGSWSTIGSFNLNYMSYQQNLEMNVDVYSTQFTQDLNARMQELIDTGCEKIEAAEFIEKASLKTRAKRFFFYIILAIVANFSIGMVFQEEEEEKHGRFYKVMLITASLVLFILGIIGAILPVMPGIPFFIMSFLLIYRQILFNNKNV